MLFGLFGAFLGGLVIVLPVYAQNEKPKEKLNLKANAIEFEGERARNNFKILASGDVKAEYAGHYTMLCDFLEYDEQTEKIKASGNVRLNAATGEAVSASSISGDKSMENGIIQNPRAFKETMFLKAQEAEKTGDVYTMKGARFSTCANARDALPDGSKLQVEGKPDWVLSASNIRYDAASDNLKIYNSVFWLKDVPVAWWPYFTINPGRTHGFLGPEFTYFNEQFGLGIPYFISTKDKSHYFLIKPQFFFNDAKPEEATRATNLSLLYDYNVENRDFFINTRLAPDSIMQDNATGEVLPDKGLAYTLESRANLYQNGWHFGYNYWLLSDRFAQIFYDNRFENYLQSNVFANYYSPGLNHVVNWDTVNFTSIAVEDAGQVPFIRGYGDYTYRKKGKALGQNTEYIGHINAIDVARPDDRYNYKRVTLEGSVAAQYKLFGFLEQNIEPGARFDYYRMYNINDIFRADEEFNRFVPNISLETSVPLLLRNQSSGADIILTPVFNAYYVREGVNNLGVNEDSLINAPTFYNVLGKSTVSGYDLLDDGLSLAYGMKLNYINRKGFKMEGFVGQRYKQYFLEDAEGAASNYVTKIAIGNAGYFFKNEALLSDSGDLVQYSKTDFKTKLGLFSFRLEHLFTNKALSEREFDANNLTYGIGFDVLPLDFTWEVSATQNLNFVGEDGKKEARFVQFETKAYHKSECLEYEFGFRRTDYVTGAVGSSLKSAGLFSTFRIIL